jgi:hypothetical protein
MQELSDDEEGSSLIEQNRPLRFWELLEKKVTALFALVGTNETNFLSAIANLIPYSHAKEGEDSLKCRFHVDTTYTLSRTHILLQLKL